VTQISSASPKTGTPAISVRRPLEYKSVKHLFPHPRNARKHSKKQIRQIADSIRRFSFTVPLLVDANDTVIAGHARLEAAKLLGMQEVPTICLDGLTDGELRAFMLADNKLTLNSEWDEDLLAQELKALSEMDLGFSLELTGFEVGEIDVRIQGLSPELEREDPADEIPEVEKALVSQTGDLWVPGRNRVLCADARDERNFQQLMQGGQARMVFTDPPYNVPIDGHASGKGAIKHADFCMASGEMSREQFTDFLFTVFALLASSTADGAFAFVFMDWRHIGEVLAAGEKAFSQLKNLCVWTKDRAGMGSLYRSQHELVFVFKNGSAAHINNVQLGTFGRYRTNVWDYPAAISFGRSGDEENVLANHPTPKPVALVADAILDCSKRGDIVLDPFLGSGTSVIAAERTGRVCYGIEVDPVYVDVGVRRWQTFTGKTAVHAESGRLFTEIEEKVKRVRL